ncbi:MAG: PAS domain S-box protein, partial [Bacteroidales bacterium]|nr:PAS domain S-box protein [Bacteroidales bacterium]
MKQFTLILPLFLLFLVLISPAIANDNSSASEDRQVIRVGVYENPPKIFIDSEGNVSGFWPVIIEYIASEEEWDIEYVHDDWSECLERLEKNEIDLMPDVVYSEERSRQYHFSNETVLVSWTRVYAKEGSDIQSLLDLDGKNVAGLKGSINLDGPEGLKELVRVFDINCTFTEVNNYTTVFELVESKEVDAGITNKDFGNKHETDFDIERTPIIFQPAHIQFALPQNSTIAPYLIERIDYHMEYLKDDPDSIYHSSMEQYLGEHEKEVIVLLPEWLKTALGGLLIVAILFLVVSIMLRRQVEMKTAELMESKKNYKLVVETIVHGIQEIDIYGKILFANSACHKMLGYEYGELIGRSIFEMVPDDYNQKKLYDYIQILAQQQPELEPWFSKTVKKDGNIIDVQTDWNYKRNRRGEVTGFISIITDITKRKQMEAALQQSEERFHLAIKGSRLGIWDWMVQTGETTFNERWAEIVGYTLEELEPISIKTWEQLTHPDDLERSDELLKDHFEGRTDIYECEARMQHKDGYWVWIIDRGKVVEWDLEGNPIRMSGTHLDITERKQAKQSLIESKALLQTLIDTLPDLIWMKDPNGVYLFCNPRVEQLFDATVSEICGRTDHDLVDKELADFLRQKDK